MEATATGLHELGLASGGVVCIVSDNRPEWVVVELAAQSLGAAVVGPHPDCSAEELAAVLTATGAAVLVVEDARQHERAVSAGSSVLATISFDARSAGSGGASGVRTLADLEATGGAIARAGWWEERVGQGEASDVALLALPSRASATPEELARPVPVRLTHANLLAPPASELLGPTRGPRLRWVSVLPLGWVWEQTTGLAA